MGLSCVQCGAPFADEDTHCSRCGLPREASYPPGSHPPAPPPAPAPVVVPAPPADAEPASDAEPPRDDEPVEAPAPAQEPSWSEPEPPAPEPDLAPFWAEPDHPEAEPPQDAEPVEAPAPEEPAVPELPLVEEPERAWDSPAEPEPEDPWGTPEPEPSWSPSESDDAQVPAEQTVIADLPRWTAPEPSFPLPGIEPPVGGEPAVPAELTYAPPEPSWSESDLYHYGPPNEGTAAYDDKEQRSFLGAFDVVVALLGAVLAFAITFILNDGDLTRIQAWLESRGCAAGNSCGLDVHDLLVQAATFSPFAIAAATSLLSRVPLIGLAVALVGQVPLIVLDNFHAGSDWPIACAIGAFLVTDLVLLVRRRGVGTGILVGLLAGLGAVAYTGVTFGRADQLDFVLRHWALDLQFFAVPGGIVLVAAFLGGVLASFRRTS